MAVTRRIPAPPPTVFAVLADPGTHADIHGAYRGGEGVDPVRIGRVDGAVDAERNTGANQRFRMAMFHEQHPDETCVTLTYDWSAATREARDVIDFPPFGPEHLHDSPAHLADVVAATGVE